MQERKILPFKCLAFNKALIDSQHFSFVPDPKWKELGYFTVNGSLIKMNTSGAWTCVIGNKILEKGVNHFSIKIKRGTQILPGFACEDDVKLLVPLHQCESYNAYYILDGTTRSKGIARHTNAKIGINEINNPLYL